VRYGCGRPPDSLVPSDDGQLGAVELGLALRHLYAAESAMANPQREPNLFLRPNKSDGTIEWPEIAIGYVTHLRIDLATTQLRAAASGGRDDELTTNPVADAVNSLALRLASLMTTVRWTCVDSGSGLKQDPG
jgi:phosphate:Na+ symporter